jgi:hypothetical protein
MTSGPREVLVNGYKRGEAGMGREGILRGHLRRGVVYSASAPSGGVARAVLGGPARS